MKILMSTNLIIWYFYTKIFTNCIHCFFPEFCFIDEFMLDGNKIPHQ